MEESPVRGSAHNTERGEAETGDPSRRHTLDYMEGRTNRKQNFVNMNTVPLLSRIAEVKRRGGERCNRPVVRGGSVERVFYSRASDSMPPTKCSVEYVCSCGVHAALRQTQRTPTPVLRGPDAR